MKKLILMSFAIVIAAVNCFAQEAKTKTTKTPEQRTERIVDKLNEKLVLTDDQKSKVKAIVLKEEQDKDAARAQFASDAKAMRESNKKSRMDADNQLKTILTANQLEKMKQMKEEQKEKRQAKNQATNGAGQTPSPPAQQK